MAQENVHRLAHARDILMGAHNAMGIAQTRPDLQLASKSGRKTPPGTIYFISGAQKDFNDALLDCATPLSWVAVAALPEIGWQRLSEQGLNLDRVVIIPELDVLGERVLYILASAMDILCVGDVPLSAQGRKRIAAKARQKGCLILSATPWQGLSRPFPQTSQAVDAAGHLSSRMVGT
ncbi:hypothetical protein [Schaalia canis]|uniref:Uncharacterized protein n=1 Tax=Schaalia canis TaxID=100469 RepID=A0A3P1SGL7_9ACTO|nr:hypothetical protein [Schaalia canis]RRC96137.1 hypothetical protein EII11_00195 [Schaalia canis]